MLRIFRRLQKTTGAEPNRPSSSWFAARVAHWRGVYATWWAAQPSVDDRNARLAADLDRQARQAGDEIARALAWQGVWLPGDREAAPVLTFEKWAGRSVLDP